MTETFTSLKWFQSFCSTSTLYFVFSRIPKKWTYTLAVKKIQCKLQKFPHASDFFQLYLKTHEEKSSFIPCQCVPWTLFKAANATVKRCLLAYMVYWPSMESLYISVKALSALISFSGPVQFPQGLPKPYPWDQEPHFSPAHGHQSLPQWCRKLAGLQLPASLPCLVMSLPTAPVAWKTSCWHW